MRSLRPDLDGRRLVSADRTHAWLIFHGMRHHIASSAVYDALFLPDTAFDESPDLDAIADGPDLGKGSCLVSNAESGEIYLVFGAPSINVRKHLIETYETFSELRFNDALVKAIPPILVSAVPSGRPIKLDVAP